MERRPGRVIVVIGKSSWKKTVDKETERAKNVVTDELETEGTGRVSSVVMWTI